MAESTETPLHYTLKNGYEFKSSKPIDHPEMQKWLGSQGLTKDDVAEVRPHTLDDEPGVKDFKSGMSAVATGLGKIPGAVLDAFNPVSKTGPEPKVGAVLEGGSLPKPEDDSFRTSIGNALGATHVPANKTEEYLQAGAEGLGSAITAPGSVLSKAAIYGVAPAVAAKAAGEATEGVKIPDWVPYVGGKDVSPAAKMLTSIFTPAVARKVVTPNTITDPTRLAANKTLKDEGIPQTAGQAVNNEKLMSSELSAKPNINEEQQKEFMKAITRKAGEEATDVTTGPSGYIARGKERASKAIDDAANSGSIDVSKNPTLLRELRGVASQYPQHVSGVGDVLYNTLGRRNLFPGGTMSGQDYQHLRSALHSEASGASPSYAHALRSVAGALDKAVSNPEEFQKARDTYENMLTLERARSASGAGDRFTPKDIERASKGVVGKSRYVKGSGDYTELAEAAKKALPQLKDKGATGSGIGHMLGLLGSAPAIAYGYAHGLPWNTALESGVYPLLAGELAGKNQTIQRLAKPLTDAVTMSKPYQAYQKNQFAPLLPEERNQRNSAMLLRALMQGRQ